MAMSFTLLFLLMFYLLLCILTDSESGFVVLVAGGDSSTGRLLC